MPQNPILINEAPTLFVVEDLGTNWLQRTQDSGFAVPRCKPGDLFAANGHQAIASLKYA